MTSEGSMSEVNWMRWNRKRRNEPRNAPGAVLPNRRRLDQQVTQSEEGDQGELDDLVFAPETV